MKKLLAILLLFPLSLLGEKRPIRILSHDRPPYHFQDSTGKIVGICVDIVDTIFREMDLNYTVSNQNWARVWYKIEQGEGEAAFTTSRKKPREPYLYYPTTDMWTSHFTFFVLKENKHLAPNGTYEEIARSGKKVGIWRGASFNNVFWQTFPNKDGTTKYNPDVITQSMYNKQLHVVNGPIQALKMVGLNRLTFCIEDRTVCLYYLKKHRIEGNIVAYENPVFSKGYPMPFLKNSDYPNLARIAQEFEERLKKMIEDGRYQAIVDKWLQ